MNFPPKAQSFFHLLISGTEESDATGKSLFQIYASQDLCDSSKVSQFTKVDLSNKTTKCICASVEMMASRFAKGISGKFQFHFSSQSAAGCHLTLNTFISHVHSAQVLPKESLENSKCCDSGTKGDRGTLNCGCI